MPVFKSEILRLGIEEAYRDQVFEEIAKRRAPPELLKDIKREVEEIWRRRAPDIYEEIARRTEKVLQTAIEYCHEPIDRGDFEGSIRCVEKIIPEAIEEYG